MRLWFGRRVLPGTYVGVSMRPGRRRRYASGSGCGSCWGALIFLAVTVAYPWVVAGIVAALVAVILVMRQRQTPPPLGRP